MILSKRKNKIVATVGPAIQHIYQLKELVLAGVDVFRLNFSHGTHEFHGEMIEKIRGVSEKLNHSIGILADLQGPKLRVGEFKDNKKYILNKGDLFTITTKKILGDNTIASTTYAKLPKDVKEGDNILINDGLISLRVIETTKTDVKCKVINGGEISSHKGINLPGINVSEPSLTNKDKEDLEFCLSKDVDYIALSFVRTGNDVKQLKKIISDKGKDIPVISKIEKPEAVANIDEIIKYSDGIMIARGDLGVEMKPEMVPIIQRQLTEKAAENHKIVITATQMLESMIENPRPTRAEASDVANAIMNGTDATMLSAETATGKYPVEAVKMMRDIAIESEKSGYVIEFDNYNDHAKENIALAIATAALFSLQESNAKAIMVFTLSGSTALLVSKIRPNVPIIALTPNTKTYNRLSLYRGVTPIMTAFQNSTDELILSGQKLVIEKKLLKPNDTVIILCGSTGLAGSTHIMKIGKIGFIK